MDKFIDVYGDDEEEELSDEAEMHIPGQACFEVVNQKEGEVNMKQMFYFDNQKDQF